MIVRWKGPSDSNLDTGQDDGWLIVGKDYAVQSLLWMGNERPKLLIVSEDNGTPVLVGIDQFDITDGSFSPSWAISEYLRGHHIGPPQWSNGVFWDDFYDGKEYAINLFNAHISTLIE